ncbi:MAG: hypothetical protein HFH93_00100 [Lachnospiraceae bacterium]|nr:hypothetical protein [Lachnospiraceae bacterium]
MNIQAVRFLIESSFKDIKVDSVQLIGSGNDCDAYEINDNIIFKFPKHERAGLNIKKEIEILRFLENKLSCPIPKVLYVGVPNGYADWIHEGLEKLKELDSCLMTS